MIEFIQHTLKCIIKHIDGCNNYELIIDSGKCTEKNNEFSFQTIAPSSFVIEKIRNDLFPFPRNNINILFDNLNILSEYACMNKYKFSFLLTHQIEHVNIIKSDNNGYCERSWNNIKLGLIAKNGKTLYKDFIIDNDIEETINKININFNLLLEDASYLELEIRLPNGSSSVIFAKGTGGFLVHEILGHMVEGDLISRGMSIFGNRINIGDKIGADFCIFRDEWTNINVYNLGRKKANTIEYLLSTRISKYIIITGKALLPTIIGYILSLFSLLILIITSYKTFHLYSGEMNLSYFIILFIITFMASLITIFIQIYLKGERFTPTFSFIAFRAFILIIWYLHFKLYISVYLIIVLCIIISILLVWLCGISLSKYNFS